MSEVEAPQELTTVPTEQGISSLGDVMSTSQLKASIKTAEAQRLLIKEFVKNQLVDGVDYGVIVGGKPTLLKPGQEKIFSLMKLTSRLEKDTDTISMLGNQPGVVAYLCRVYRGGEEIAQGRGAAIVGDKKRDVNSTIKIAEKRARMDACLSLGFSEFFTQDLEDPDYRGNDTPREATQRQKDFLKDLVKQALTGRDVNIGYLKEFYKVNGIEDPGEITADQASTFIEALKSNSYQLPLDETDTSDEGVVIEAEATQEEIDAKFARLSMTIRDQMRIYRTVTGQPTPPKDGKCLASVGSYLDSIISGVKEDE